jgi:death on curing protein
MFVDLNRGQWTPNPPDTDEAVDAMIAVAAREVDEAWFADWLRERVQFSDDIAG